MENKQKSEGRILRNNSRRNSKSSSSTLSSGSSARRVGGNYERLKGGEGESEGADIGNCGFKASFFLTLDRKTAELGLRRFHFHGTPG